MKNKKCSGCKKYQPINKFYKRPDGKTRDGLEYRCSDCQKISKKKWYDNNKTTVKARFGHFRGATKQRKNISFELTMEEYAKIIANPCHYCGDSVDGKVGSSVDRKNNDLGYTLDNSVACCEICNKGKGEFFTEEEWKTMIIALKQWRKVRELNSQISLKESVV